MEQRSQDPKLDDRISVLHAHLSPKHKHIARFILNNKYFMAFASAHQVGERLGTSAATVVRFAQTLGYNGYPDMQEAIRSDLPSYLQAIDRLKVQLESPELDDKISQVVFQRDINNIQLTAKNLSPEKLEAVVQMLKDARRLLVIGCGISSSAAVFLAHSLKIMGLDARYNTNEGINLATELAQLEVGDLIIAIDMWRYVRSTVNAVKMAKAAGASVVTINDSIVSPLAESADFAFEVVTDGVAHSLSITALMSLLNVIIAALSLHIPGKVLHSLERVDSSYRESNLLVSE